ncbi:pollen-specific leucine-rich repeat extensin-like protein 4 [Iris pallida]|uniref:Pollen-specific leucine-rich repeat extensin-like protein 4 n=1 Tax=Iris pallida TaxID=29817 RepID=A0AAX6G9W3_IRIPA|nr:pollen-specific leucine-rich repeat extensin-like protein 4 [Iris pallida]
MAENGIGAQPRSGLRGGSSTVEDGAPIRRSLEAEERQGDLARVRLGFSIYLFWCVMDFGAGSGEDDVGGNDVWPWLAGASGVFPWSGEGFDGQERPMTDRPRRRRWWLR